MKSYLSLIPISAKVHKRQNRMTLLCIIFAVFLVTAVFSMADMGVRMEKARLFSKHGAQALKELGSNETVQLLYLTAGVLFILILAAGVLMIAGSINSNVSQRIKFFGMMRCIGMSRKQIILFVRLESLNWCRTAVPIGVALGIVITWALCAALRFLVGEEFAGLELWRVSPIGIVSGIVVGVVTVLIAARTPAKRAAQVSPIAAVSGASQTPQNTDRTVNARIFKIETALGIHHAVSARKNLFLMTGSFALSIILFLSFSVLIEFVGHLMPQYSSDSDLYISSIDGSNSIDELLLCRVGEMDGVKRVFGRRSCFDLQAQFENAALPENTVDVIAYDNFDLDCLVKDKLLKKGSDISNVYGDSRFVLGIWDKDSPLEKGDKIQIGHEELEIAGMLKYDIFNSSGRTNGKITLITSGETFARLTGVKDYSLVMVQTTGDAGDEDVKAINGILDNNCVLQDKRDQRTTGTYMAFMLFVYGFLAIITLVTVLNIVNSISMSVSARIKQYGAMRAVGMDDGQITKMIAAEAFTYALSGCLAGCTVGLMISKLLYSILITPHFTYACWSVPAGPMTVIFVFVLSAAAAAVYAPVKRIRHISVTETINQL